MKTSECISIGGFTGASKRAGWGDGISTDEGVMGIDVGVWD